MKLIKNSFKICFLVFSLAWSMLLFAAPVSLQILFLDNAGQSVGNGQFTYDPATSICIERDQFGCQPNPSGAGFINGFDVSTVLDSISIDLAGQNWGTGTERGLAGQSWWYNEPSISPGSQIVDRGTFSIKEGWHFYDGPAISFTESLIMSNFTSTTSASWVGDWNTFLMTDGTPGGEGGTFIIGEVPEVPVPGAILLFSSGLIVLASRKKIR
ncbi:MAG: hypothetical protein L3J59_08145 [Methylococcaceae bacterium]|nr:hypothetical protein [Methylococcaceae bacterium]